MRQISPALPDDAVDEYLKAFADADRRRSQLELYRSGDFSKLEPYRGKLAALGVPTLILWGERDEFAPVAGAHRFQQGDSRCTPGRARGRRSLPDGGRAGARGAEIADFLAGARGVTISSIVVGTDGSEAAALAVETAADLAASLGARVHVVSAYKPAAVRIAEADAGPEVQDWMVGSTTEVEAVLQEAAGAVLARGVELESYARKGDAAAAILDVAEEQGADLIVVGNKGMQGTTRFLIGSVPDKLSHHASCSVLIVRTT